MSAAIASHDDRHLQLEVIFPSHPGMSSLKVDTTVRSNGSTDQEPLQLNLSSDSHCGGAFLCLEQLRVVSLTTKGRPDQRHHRNECELPMSCVVRLRVK